MYDQKFPAAAEQGDEKTKVCMNAIQTIVVRTANKGCAGVLVLFFGV